MNNSNVNGSAPEINRNENAVVITAQTDNGSFKAHLYPSLEEAEKKMEMLKANYGVDENRHLKDGFYTPKGCQIRLVPFDMAFNLDGRILWEVSHTCFYPETNGEHNWSRLFGNRTSAMDFFEEKLRPYWSQAAQLRQIHIERDLTHAAIFVNDELAVKLEMNPLVIGETDPSAGLALTAFLENGEKVDLSKMFSWS